MSIPRLLMTDMHKAFGATKALNGVSFQVAAGEIHALIGENGAGKSTLMKILGGVHSADSGECVLDGVPFIPKNPLHARRSGVAMIHQELNLAPHLTVEQNLVLGDEPHRFGWIDRRGQRASAREALARLHQKSIPLDLPVSRLTIAQKQVVEIARGLIGEARVIVMDEPTSSLTQHDTANLFEVIRRLRDQGVAVIYISHFLEECQALCTRFTVLRDGRSVGSGEIGSVSLPEIIRMMVGRNLNEIYPKIPHTLGETVYELRDIAGLRKPRRVTLQLRAGEILGIAGLVGAGRTETLRAAFGLDPVRDGMVVIDGAAISRMSPALNLLRGVGLLSENRKEEGLMLNRSIADNLTATRYGPVSRFGLISSRHHRRTAARWMEVLGIRARDPRSPVGQLSGGNQQKVAIARLLHHEAKIFLFDEPTRGIDVASKALIYRLIGDLSAAGKSVLFVSSYLPELFGVCDTIAVMSRGVLSAIKPAAEWTEHGIMEFTVAGGVSAA